MTAAVIHEFKPVPTNLEAPKNVESRVIRDVVIHLLMPVPIKCAALVLPSIAYAPPALSRCHENAWLKSFTPLTSQVPMSPHLPVAAMVFAGRFWTQSHEASLNVKSVSGGYKVFGGEGVGGSVFVVDIWYRIPRTNTTDTST